MTEKKPRPRGQVEDLGAGKFRVRVPLRERGPSGRSRTHSEILHNSTPLKAAKRRDALMAQIDAGVFFVPAPITVRALSEEWMTQQRRKDLAVTTVTAYQDWLNSYVLPHVGNLQLRDLQPKSLEALFNRLQDRGLAHSTIRGARAVCKGFLKYAVRMRYLRENPLDGVETPKGAEPREGKSMTREEAAALAETALLDLDDLVFVFALFTGLRPKEYLGLHESNVELVSDGAAVVRVRRQAVRLRGGGYVFPEPKTKKGVRDVPFPVWLHRELTRLRAANAARARALGAAWEDHGLVFPSPTGRPLGEERLRRSFARLLKRAGLSEQYTPYSLRHTFNTLLASAGVHDKARCALMGHAREDFNRRVYVHALPEMFEGVVETLERRILGDARTSFAPGGGGRLM
jgi:integrase